MDDEFSTLPVKYSHHRVLLFDNNQYFVYAVNQWAMSSHNFISVTASAEGFFQRLEINSFIDTVLISYNPVWSRTLHILHHMREHYPQIKVIVLVDFPHIPSVTLVRSFGVKKIIAKQDSLQCVNEAITLSAECFYLSPSVARLTSERELTAQVNCYPRPVMLTQMERVIMAELCRDKSIPSIARERGCSVKTISQHKQNALWKMGYRKLKEIFFLPRGCASQAAKLLSLTTLCLCSFLLTASGELALLAEGML